MITLSNLTINIYSNIIMYNTVEYEYYSYSINSTTYCLLYTVYYNIYGNNTASSIAVAQIVLNPKRVAVILFHYLCRIIATAHGLHVHPIISQIQNRLLVFVLLIHPVVDCTRQTCNTWS